MSKKSRPTAEELKFVYGLLLKGYEDVDILAEYAGLYDKGTILFPYRTDKRFVRERRKELESAKAVLEEHIMKVANPVIIQSMQKHFNDLAEVARAFLDGGLEKINDSYSIIHENYEEEKLSKGALVARLEGNLDVTRQHYSPKKVFDYLFKHVESEYPNKDIYGLINSNPLEFISIMSLLAERKTFKGKCSVCKEW